MKLVDLLNEIKVKSPGGIIPVSLDTFKAALVQDMANTAEELEFENPEEYIADFKQALSEVPDNINSLVEIFKIYEYVANNYNDYWATPDIINSNKHITKYLNFYYILELMRYLIECGRRECPRPTYIIFHKLILICFYLIMVSLEQVR